jgi:hypothetical protein
MGGHNVRPQRSGSHYPNSAAPLFAAHAMRGSLPNTIVSPDLHVVCLWSAFGLALNGLFFALGFGAEIGQALMAAG